MTPESSESPPEGYMNDASQQLDAEGEDCQPSATATGPENARDCDGPSHRIKRIACVLCRKRKLRCDGVRPTCGTCKRLAHDCAYDEVRKKSGPKRGYVKLLEARLHEVEKLLKSQENTDPSKEASQTTAASYVANTIASGLPERGRYLTTADQVSGRYPESISPGPESFTANGSTTGSTGNPDFPFEMIGLGLEEPLPPQDVINDLYQIYFSKIHPSVPVIHRPRFLAALNLAAHMRPPVCLRYIMWTLAASVTDKYDGLQDHFYQRARKYAQMDEMKGHGESTITLAHCQAWTLMATYEFKMMYFPRAWLSAGRACRLAQMMQLHRLDGVGLDVKQCIPPPKDWTEREERRRTFWMAFCVDRYASIGTGWPMTIDERDILTNLPASEEAFDKSKPMPTGSLQQVMAGDGISALQPFGAIVLTASMFGNNLLHLHRPGADDNDDDLNGGFWTRHRKLENILLSTSLGLPDHLRLPGALPDPSVVFMNMALHTSAICLHQAAIFKADKYRLPVTISNESKIRCVTAAAEIASVMRMISHMDLGGMNPFISFCVYVAARVFVQYLKTRPKDQQMNSSLQFLLQAMQALRRRNPLTESFLVQLDLDLEGSGIQGAQKPLGRGPAEIPVNSDAVGCSPLFDVRESQAGAAPVNTFGNRPAVVPSNANTFAAGTSGSQFAVSGVSLGVDPPPPYAHATSQQNVQMDLPQRQRSFRNPLSRDQQLNDSEMDLSPDAIVDQPTPSTINSQSRGGSTSNTSYSPSQQQDDSHGQQFNAASQSTQPLPQSGHVPLTNSSSSDTNNGFFSAAPAEQIFQTAFFNQPVNMQDDPMSTGYILGSDWDMGADLSNSTGMTPMNEGAWHQMLESVTLGWDSLGPPHAGPHQG